MTTTRADAEALDATDPLRAMRERFELPDDLIYLCGNSLGALPRGVGERVAQVVGSEWGRGLVGSWNTAGWSRLTDRVAVRLAPLLGAEPADVVVGDSTSVMLYKLLVAAARLRPDRRVIVVEPTTFPTDGYIVAGVADTLGLEVRWCDPADPAATVDDDVAVVCLTQVDFRTGALYDLASVTAAVRAHDAIMVWDLCHSTGAVPVDLRGADADLAVGCGYKFLNGGPGAPAYAWVHPRHHDHLDQPLTGWWGHARPFAMEQHYEPLAGVGRLATGTPSVIAVAALEAALAVFDGVGVDDLRARSSSLTGLMIDTLTERVPGVEILTPRDPGRRGSQVSVRHDAAYGIVQALIARGVVGDFRAPDIARFGIAPLYVSHVDVWDAVDHLVGVLETQEHLRPEHQRRQAVT